MISVVVPVLIRTDEQITMTARCLESAQKTQQDFELVIVETESRYFQDSADIHIYEKKKTNATKSINRGFKVASGDYVVLLTNDVVLDDRWLECLLDCFNSKHDCGLATLATTQLGHAQKDEISEGVWFSVAMMQKEYALFDESYVNSWDDTDLIMKMYLKGFKMYRNFNCVVDHLVGQTQYADTLHRVNFEKNRRNFMNKYSDYKNNRMYKILTEGVIL